MRGECDVRNIWRVCHTGCSYNTWRFGSGSSQFSTHCISWVDHNIRMRSGRGQSNYLVLGPKGVASTLPEHIQEDILIYDNTYSEDHPRN